MPKHDNDICWVEVVPPDRADGPLTRAYGEVTGPDGRVENLYLAMSQTPGAIGPADAHYRALLHNPDNPLAPWLSELIATYVAILCDCPYAVANHGANFRMYLSDNARADRLMAALHADALATLEEPPSVLAALGFTRKLTLDPGAMGRADVRSLRLAGYSDKGLSYIIQIAASFAYWSRMINALGTRLGATVGLADEPAPDP